LHIINNKQKKTTMKTQIELLQENIKRLENQISMSFTFQKGYIENCKNAIESYKKQIEKLSK
jgi:hypothetical protein